MFTKQCYSNTRSAKLQLGFPTVSVNTVIHLTFPVVIRPTVTIVLFNLNVWLILKGELSIKKRQGAKKKKTGLHSFYVKL